MSDTDEILFDDIYELHEVIGELANEGFSSVIIASLI